VSYSLVSAKGNSSLRQHQDPMLIVGQLMQTFFPQTLTILCLADCKNVPSTIFLVCPQLQDVLLDDVEVTEKSYDKYPDKQCSDRQLPALARLDYCNSESLVQQIITLPPRFITGVVLWSKLRVLKLSLCQIKKTACLQLVMCWLGPEARSQAKQSKIGQAKARP
jgi:hypothetical protein